MSKEDNNPFKITTPEGLSADATVKLFVDVFSDFYNVIDPGNVFIRGPRGVGKSMMLRYLEPDCQCLEKNVKIGDLSFIAVYVPLKNTNFSLAELDFFANKHAYALLNEHFMVLYCLSMVFLCLSDKSVIDDLDSNRLYEFYKRDFLRILEIEDSQEVEKTSEAIMQRVIEKLNTLQRELFDYLKICNFSESLQPYTGGLFDYNYYFVPLVSQLAKAISNQEEPPVFYLMLDDAHYLSEVQTRVLNTWIASRASMKVSLKVSTQYDYKTYYTLNGATIDTPHDYTDVDIATIYTAAKDTYSKRIQKIVKRRLELFGIDADPEAFFPPDEEQEKEIKRIEEEYIARSERGEGRGANKTDDAKRYARPDYIKNLAGMRKSSHTYSYAGYNQLVNISSGVVRTFLHLAHEMYAMEHSRLDDESRTKRIESISPGIQNEAVREYANKTLFTDIEKYSIASTEGAYPKDEIERLENLIKGLGGFFRVVLISERSERRVFSVAISDKLSDDIKRTLDIGVSLGFFHKSTIGRKESGSIGRTRLYVLNRMLAPIWNLDPNGFAGYLFIKNAVLEQAINEPIKAITEFKKHIENNDDSEYQISIFDLNADVQTDKAVEVFPDESEY